MTVKWNKGKDTVASVQDSLVNRTEDSFINELLSVILIELKLINKYNAISHGEELKEEDL